MKYRLYEDQKQSRLSRFTKISRDIINNNSFRKNVKIATALSILIAPLSALAYQTQSSVTNGSSKVLTTEELKVQEAAANSKPTNLKSEIKLKPKPNNTSPNKPAPRIQVNGEIISIPEAGATLTIIENTDGSSVEVLVEQQETETKTDKPTQDTDMKKPSNKKPKMPEKNQPTEDNQLQQ